MSNATTIIPKVLVTKIGFDGHDRGSRVVVRLQMDAHVEADAVWQTQTGLEFWFTPPPGTVVAQPSCYRMALVLIVVVFTLVRSIGRVVGMVMGEAPQPVRLFVTIAIEVFLLTYVVMPRLTRVLERWTHPSVRAG